MTTARVLILLAALGTSGCATIAHGRMQEVAVATAPAGASIFVDGTRVGGTTPTTVKLLRKRAHVVRIELAGFQPLQTRLERRVSGWVWMNFTFSNVIGIGIDALTGSMYALEPDQVLREFAPGPPSPGTLYVVLTQRSDSLAPRLGTLQRKSPDR